MTFRQWTTLLAISSSLSLAAPEALGAASCDTMDPCAAKACRIDAEIAQAKARNNSKQLAGLERARAEIGHCSDDGLKQKRKVALEQAQRRIDAADAEVKKAEASGDPAKVKKGARKLESARKAYSEIQNSPL